MRMHCSQAVRPRHRITRDPRVLDAAAAVALLRNSNPAPARANAPGSRSGVRRPQTPAAAAAAAAAQAVRPHVPGSRSGARRPSAPLAAAIKVGGVPLTMYSSRPRQVRRHHRQPIGHDCHTARMRSVRVHHHARRKARQTGPVAAVQPGHLTQKQPSPGVWL